LRRKQIQALTECEFRISGHTQKSEDFETIQEKLTTYSIRLNERKDDYLSSLNRLKEKAIRSKFPLNMTNDMLALASDWEDRLRPPKCDKKENPQVWATSFPHLLTLTQKEKS